MPDLRETIDATCLKAEKLGVNALRLQINREIADLRQESPSLSKWLDLFSAMVDVAAMKLNNPVTSPSDEALSEPM